MNLQDFISLSEFLLGIPLQPPLVLSPITDLDPDLANIYFTQLNQYSPQASFMNSLLAKWTQIQQQPANQWTNLVNTQIMNDPNLGLLARQIILAWYNGFHPWFPGQQPTPDPANYERALVWVLAQAHPMGVPLSFGYWQYPPSGA